MGERELVQQRCLAVQLVRSLTPASSPASSDSSSGDTTTPTNGPVTTIATTAHQQDGYHLFLAWQAANLECSWDGDLVRAARAIQYLGHLISGVLLVGGPADALATLTLSWSRSLLAAPSGYKLVMLGEVQGWSVAVVPQGQFTPLSDALCWVVHHLTREGCKAGAEAVRASLVASFPTLTTPAPAHVHATLSTLIQQCKVYYTGATYGIVQPNTYCPSITHPSKSPALAGDGQVHAAAQTDLAELITGITQPMDTVITPTYPGGICDRQGRMTLDTTKLGHQHHHHHHHHHHPGRAASLRLSPTRASLLATTLAAVATATTHSYQAHDLSDISIRGERGSVFSKLLRVPGRRRMATFAAQFPPPEWSNSQAPALHLHSVAVQTSTQDAVRAWHWSGLQWTPRSASLPRRLKRAQSSTPPLPHSQHSSPVPRGSSSLLQLNTAAVQPQGGPQSHNHHDRRSRLQRLQSPVCKRNENSYQSSSSESISDNTHCSSISHQLNYKKKQTNGGGQRGKALGSIFTNTPGSSWYKQQPPDPSKSEEKLLEMLKEPQIKMSENEVPDARQQDSRQKQERVNSMRYSIKQPDNGCHLAYNKHAKPRKHNLHENKPEKNQQGGDTKHIENQGHTVTQEEESLNDKGKINKKKAADLPRDGGGEKQQYQRMGLQLELISDNMNNCRKVVASPQRPHGLTTNLLHQPPDLHHITKGSTPDLTSRNLGYQEVDKCHKKLCSQTLDQLQRQTPPTTRSGKLVTSPGSKGLPDGPVEGEVRQDARSVSTYPSLSELNLTFSSLAAQKILSGASVNSLDTLAEVNLAALKRNTKTVTSALTNTDLGFV